jgi:uncharacterized protein with PIN domain
MAREADPEAQWQRLSAEVLTGLREWRAAHPRATFAEIEAAVEERVQVVRARLLEDLALASAAADLTDGEAAACPTCGHRLQRRGAQTRTLTVPGAQAVQLRRQYAVCPACRTGLFPPG